MKMNGRKLYEEAKVVNMLAAEDINGGKVSNYVSLKNYGHLTILFSLGSIAGTATVSIIQSTDTSGTTTKELAGVDRYMKAIGDAVEAVTEVTGIEGTASWTAGLSTGVIQIEVDAAMLDVDNGYDCVAVSFTDPSASDYVAILGLLTNPRYMQNSMPTALS